MADTEAPKTWGKTEAAVETGIDGGRTAGPFTEVINEYKRHHDKAVRRSPGRNGNRIKAAEEYQSVIETLTPLNRVEDF